MFIPPPRYHHQEFIEIKYEQYANVLAKMGWTNKDDLDRQLRLIAIGQRIAIVPHLVQGFLRVKVVSKNCQIKALQRNNRVEKKLSACGKHMYYFGYEPKQLNHRDAFGFLVSSWEISALSTSVELTYDFLKEAILIMKRGFGKRGGIFNAALNAYFKIFGRGNTRPHPSAAVAEDEVGAQQYCNKNFGNDLTSPFVRKVIHDLLDGIYTIAQRHNPELMELVNDTCCRGILTTGHIPKVRPTKIYKAQQQSRPTGQGRSKGRKDPVKGCRLKVKHSNTGPKYLGMHLNISSNAKTDNSDFGFLAPSGDEMENPTKVNETCSPGNVFTKLYRPAIRLMSFKAPPIGFFNTSHIDVMDKLTKDQRKSWLQIARTRQWSYCLEILHERNDMFCLPTTCAYQFVFRTEGAKFDLHPIAFFSMEGLSMAMELQHGLTHHFMGAAFSHHTCIPLCRRRSDGFINTTNSDDNILIMAWGSNGGVREVREKQQRQEAPSLNAANARIRVLEGQLLAAGLTPA